MSVFRKSSSVVRFNAKIESQNLLRLPAPAAGTTIAEGVFVSNDDGALGTGATVLGSASSPVVFMNWVGSTRSDVNDVVTDPETGESLVVDTGGLTGIIGANTLLGLPIENVAGAAAVTDVYAVNGGVTTGYIITCGASGAVTMTAEPLAEVDLTDNIADSVIYSFGRVYKIEGGIVWFFFNSIGTPISGD